MDFKWPGDPFAAFGGFNFEPFSARGFDIGGRKPEQKIGKAEKTIRCHHARGIYNYNIYIFFFVINIFSHIYIYSNAAHELPSNTVPVPQQQEHF